MRRTAAQMQVEPHGAWIHITLKDDPPVDGELIAVERLGFVVLVSAGMVRVPLAAIREARVVAFDTTTAGATTWTVLGMLSSVSHGVFLIFSVPGWVLLGGITAASESVAGFVDYPATRSAELAKWARFPQGLPPDGFGVVPPAESRPAAPRPAGIHRMLITADGGYTAELDLAAGTLDGKPLAPADVVALRELATAAAAETADLRPPEGPAMIFTIDDTRRAVSMPDALARPAIRALLDKLHALQP
jgi:hypothetical protein